MKNIIFNKLLLALCLFLCLGLKIERKPYNFTVTIKWKTIRDGKIITYDIADYIDSVYLKHFLIVEEDSSGNILARGHSDKEMGFGEIFKVKKEEVENFKNSMLNGGSFKCTLIKSEYLSKEERHVKRYEYRDMPIVISENHAFFDLPSGKTSIAIPLDDLKKYLK